MEFSARDWTQSATEQLDLTSSTTAICHIISHPDLHISGAKHGLAGNWMPSNNPWKRRGLSFEVKEPRTFWGQSE